MCAASPRRQSSGWRAATHLSSRIPLVPKVWAARAVDPRHTLPVCHVVKKTYSGVLLFSNSVSLATGTTADHMVSSSVSLTLASSSA